VNQLVVTFRRSLIKHSELLIEWSVAERTQIAQILQARLVQQFVRRNLQQLGKTVAVLQHGFAFIAGDGVALAHIAAVVAAHIADLCRARRRITVCFPVLVVVVVVAVIHHVHRVGIDDFFRRQRQSSKCFTFRQIPRIALVVQYLADSLQDLAAIRPLVGVAVQHLLTQQLDIFVYIFNDV